MKVVLHPTYFSSIAQFVVLANKEVVFEIHDNFQKQTYRNRMFLYSANGKQLLSIPIKHAGTKDGRQLYKDVKIDDSFNWQKIHWKSIEAAYRTSPFFEFYEDDIAPLLFEKHTFLMDFNIKTIQTVCDCIGLDFNYEETSSYQKIIEHTIDARSLVNAKSDKDFNLQTYTQVFENKHGHLSNLSILDLLFNEGTNALSYLQNQEIKL